MLRINYPLRTLLSLAIPTALAHMANMLLQVVDTAVLGLYSSAALGGASVGNTLFVVFHLFILGIVLSNDYFVSRAYGRGDEASCHSHFWHGLVFSGLLCLPAQAALMICSSETLGAPLLVLLGVEPEFHFHARSFLQSVSWSLLPNTIAFLFRQYFQSKNKAGSTLLIYVLTNLVNLLGNYVFVFGHFGVPEMGAFGSGLSTTLARWFSVICFIIYTLKVETALFHKIKSHLKNLKKKVFFEMMKIGFPISGSLLLEVGAFALSTIILSRLTVANLAAHQIVLQIASLTFMIPLGIGAAAASQIGQELGRKNYRSLSDLGKTSLLFTSLVMILIAGTLLIGNHFFLGLFTQDPATLEIASTLLLIAGAFQLFDGIQVVAAGLLRGLGHTRPTFIANLFGHWFLGLPIGVFLAFYGSNPLGATGVWIGLSIGLGSVALLLTFSWKKALRGFTQPPN